MNGTSKIRLVAAVGAAALAALAVTSPSYAAKPKKPKCQTALVSIAEGSGLPLYTWTACGRRVGTPFG
jgi:hypothetical protein